MAKGVVKKAGSAPAENVAAAAKAAVAEVKEKKPRTPPAPTGYTTGGAGDKRVPWTAEEVAAALKGKDGGVYLLEKEWRGKSHYSIIVWNGTAVEATKGGSFDLDRTRGFAATHARKYELNMQHEPGGALEAPPKITRKAPAEGAEGEEVGEEEEAEAEEAPAKTTKKVVTKKA